MKEKIVIVGAGQHCNVVLYNMREQGKYEPACILDIDKKIWEKKLNGVYVEPGYKDYDELVKDDGEVLNLASKEYSKAVEPYVKDGVRFVTCVFGTYVNGKLKVKATEAKMARGEMVRLCAENNVQSVDEVKAYNVRGYVFNEELSSETEFVFVK